MDSNDPQKPPYGAGYANAGVPVAMPIPPPPQQQQQQQAMYGQPAQVDQYGRPIVTAVPTSMTSQPPHLVENNANIRRDPQGNALCNKCNTPYPLPRGCTSWRCRNCHELNNASVYGDECGWCTIL